MLQLVVTDDNRQLRAQSVCVFELSLEVSLQIIDLALIAVSRSVSSSFCP